MSDIEAYAHYRKYSRFQLTRPDYVPAIKTALQYADKMLPPQAVIADFCCGPGENTKKLAEIHPLKKAILIDINKNFIDHARKNNIKADKTQFILSDILKAPLKKECNAVLSIFAYHHIPNNLKGAYLKKIKECLIKGGIVVLAEIYLKDKGECIKYYDKLYQSIKEKSPELKKFLEQTARSETFEFKVTKEYADKQFKAAGFKLIGERKIWPKTEFLAKGRGTFVQVYKLE